MTSIDNPRFSRKSSKSLARRLLDQQMWCFGQDIRHADGNLLIRFGFERFAAPDPKTGCTAYVMHPDQVSELVLWGFGLFYGQTGAGAIYLGRFTFTPMVMDVDRLPQVGWRTEQLPQAHRPRGARTQRSVHRMLFEVVNWLASYEDWIVTVTPREYRRDCIAQWSKAVVPAEGMADGWREIAAMTNNRLERTKELDFST